MDGQALRRLCEPRSHPLSGACLSPPLAVVWLVWMPLFTVVYVFVEAWEPWESFVFVATCISTIGSGNVAPRTQSGRLLTIICGLGGIPLTFGAIAWVGEVSLHIIELQLKLVAKKCHKGAPVTKKQRVLMCFNLLIGVYLHAVLIYCLLEGWTVRARKPFSASR